MNVTSSLTTAQKAIYYPVYWLLYLLSLIPLRALYFFSDLFYYLFYYVIRYRRRLVRRNLTSSFPQKSSREIVDIERKFYRWLCDYMAETVKMASMSREEMRRRVSYNNLEHLESLLSRHRNVALYLGHYCNWEWVTSIGLYVPEDCLGGQVYHPLENKVADAIMRKLRSSMGTESIPMSHIMRRIITARREGRRIVIGFISDQVPIYPNAHYWTDFLNHPDTLVITGTERLAKLADFACVYLDMRRDRRGHYEINIVPMTDSPADFEDYAITELYFRLFEKTIERQPHLWLWTHNRWKRSYKGLIEWSRDHNKDIDTDKAKQPQDETLV